MSRFASSVGSLVGVLLALEGDVCAQRVPSSFETCTVQVLNQTVKVRADGQWTLPNIPSNGGQVRARLNCQSFLGVVAGQSPFFVIKRNRMNAIASIPVGDTDTGPTRLTIAATLAELTVKGQVLSLAVTGTYPGGAVKDVSSKAAGTSYLSTNPAVLSVDEAGTVTAHKSGTAVVTAWNQGISGTLWLKVKVGSDTDGDGLADDWETQNGLDPNNALDALADADADGLTSKAEFEAGTSPLKADTDGDGLADGEEVAAGLDGWTTNPLLKDGDGDGLPDPIEIETGTDPNDGSKFDFAAALVGLESTPSSLTLYYNAIFGEVSAKVRVRGLLIDGTAIDLTAHPQTIWSTDDISVASFGPTAGEVFAGVAGVTTVTARVATHTVDIPVTVHEFTPQPLGAVALGCPAVGVALSGTKAFVACKNDGVRVVSFSTPTQPEIVDDLSTPGPALSVAAAGGLLWVASGTAGLAGFDVGPVGSVATGGEARAVALSGSLAAVAAGGAGLALVDVAAPKSPTLLGTLALGDADDVALSGTLAAVALKNGDLVLADVSNPAAPKALGSTSLGARAVALSGTTVYAAIGNAGLALVDAATLKTISTIGPGSFMLNDVAVRGKLAFGADYYRVNSVPIVQVGLAKEPIFAGLVEFSKYNDANGVAIDADDQHVAMLGNVGAQSFLFLGQYATIQDTAGVAPTCVITNPDPGAEITSGAKVQVSVAALDDVFVSEVRVTLDGVKVGTTSLPPYAVAAKLPSDLQNHTFGAVAVDLAGNEGVCTPVPVSLIPDPGTNVIGVVVDEKGAPVSDAQVAVAGEVLTATTEADGTFLLVGAHTAEPLVLAVMGDVGTSVLYDTFGPFTPVPKGTTDAGVLVLKTPIGSHIVAGLVAEGVPFYVTKSTPAGAFGMGAVVARPVTWYRPLVPNDGTASSMGAIVASAVPFVVRTKAYSSFDPLGAVVAAPLAFTRVPWVLGVTPTTVSAADGVALLTLDTFGGEDVTEVIFLNGGVESPLIAATNVAIDPSGAVIDVTATVSPLAPLGTWTVVLVTATGDSPTVAGPSNTFLLEP